MSTLLGTKEAAERLGLSLRRVQQLIETGALPAQKLGRDYVVEESALSKVTVYGKAGRPPKDKTDGKAKPKKANN